MEEAQGPVGEARLQVACVERVVGQWVVLRHSLVLEGTHEVVLGHQDNLVGCTLVAGAEEGRHEVVAVGGVARHRT